VTKRRIALITPALTAGGAERVMSVLANQFVRNSGIEVHLILLVKEEIFYRLDERVIVHEPHFDYKTFARWKFTLKILRYLRHTLKTVSPESLLSFGGRYNSFVLLASLGCNIKTFISDRSRPGISYGRITDLMNKFIYRWSTGVVAQTTAAQQFVSKVNKHKNITVIGNPLPQNFSGTYPDQKIILNVGRFIKSKQQIELIRIFNALPLQVRKDWQLWFLGTGEYLPACKELTKELNLEKEVQFLGNQKAIESYYQKASVFAFTSISEGFPNVLGEAMSAGCACISFDCYAGPKDLIDSDFNGVLVEENDFEAYQKALETLLVNVDKRTSIQQKAVEKIRMFDEEKISTQYLNFLIN
jgi:GalNAc-alpha-(1->4)-GalNAc-alpha-(1->3)-diNAcBac-PP-undecaprenol alpha-1,4-N-acetyl-D-galactosaminyltransferase